MAEKWFELTVGQRFQHAIRRMKTETENDSVLFSAVTHPV